LYNNATPLYKFVKTGLSLTVVHALKLRAQEICLPLKGPSVEPWLT
jgi:hypothetical protein